MATRTKLVEDASVGTSFEDIGAQVKPPNGIKWTLVEFSAGFGVLGTPANGRARIKFDEEIYHDIIAKIHNTLGQQRQKNREIVAIDVVQPHFLQVQAQSIAATIEFAMELTVEESAAGA